jgi:hypothetical protein
MAGRAEDLSHMTFFMISWLLASLPSPLPRSQLGRQRPSRRAPIEQPGAGPWAEPERLGEASNRRTRLLSPDMLCDITLI